MNNLLTHGFPVLNAPKGCVKRIDVTKLDSDHARTIHSQTLERLAERGGLCVQEIKLNIERDGFEEIRNYNEQECIDLVNSIAFNK